MDIYNHFTDNIISGMFSSEITVNCWFCNENSRVKKSEQQSWVCSSCEQYNGFNEEGDYNIELREQYNVKNDKTKTLCTPVESGVVKSLLCEQCSQNQVVKVRQLAAFTPFHEMDYDREADMYSDYLEQLYSLCASCEAKVKNFLSSLNLSLMSQLDDSQQHKLAELRQRDILTDHIDLTSSQTSYQNLLSRIMLAKCALCTLLLTLVNLRLLAGSLGTVDGSGISSYLNKLCVFLIAAIPGHLALDMRSSIAFVGVALCLCGLYLAGKYSYYPEDVLHLLLWLQTVIVLSVADIPLSWNVCLNLCTLCVSVLCCLRDRLPRNITSTSIQRKDLMKTTNAKVPCAVEAVLSPRDSSSVNALRSSSQSATSSHGEEISEPIAQFEAVRQNLESVSLGLGRKCGSSSSIWSVPAIVTSSSSNPCLSSHLIPDSSTPHHALPRGGVLAPSRLGFLSSDTYAVLKDQSSESSRSPSPRSPMATLSPRAESPTVSTPLVFKSPLCQNETSAECDSPPGPCDSQGDSFRLSSRTKTFGSADRTDLHHKLGIDPKILKPKALRRSSRIAMAGRPLKPWKLQKSQTFACVYDFHNRKDADDFPNQQLDNKTVSRDLQCSNNKSIFHKEQPKPNTSSTSGSTKQKLLKTNSHLSLSDKNSYFGLSDISDDENWAVNKEAAHMIKHINGAEVSWPWILLGLVIGISITTNVFLLCC